MAQPLDAARLELSGSETPIAERIGLGVAGGPWGQTGAFSVSESGVLAYQTGLEYRSQLAWLDRSGKQIAVVGDQGDYSDVELSPDGKQATVSLLDPMTGTRDIWIYDLSRGVRTRFTFDPSDELRAIWSPDQSRIVFNSLRRGRLDLYEKASDGSGEEKLLLADTFDKFPESWSPDGGSIIYHHNALNRQVDLWVLPLSGNRKPIPLLPTPFSEGAPARFSPDGKWIAFWSNEAGRDDVYVSGFPGSAGKSLISATGGDWPRWGLEGREIVYLAPDNKLMAVEARSRGSAFEVSAPRTLFEIRPRIARYPYDVTGDGQRFLVNMLVQETPAAPITLLVNWRALLRNE